MGRCAANHGGAAKVSKGFHIIRDGDVLTLARRLPARFDLEASATLPLLRRGRLAHQVRQDLWRALRGLRGFSPVIELRRHADGLTLRAGGQVDGAIPATARETIAQVITDPCNQARWIAHARPRGAS